MDMTTKARITVRSARDGYSAGNLECACLIAIDPVAYPEGSLMAEWADVVLSRAAQPDEALAGPLFESRAA
jgi:hypothetical protein